MTPRRPYMLRAFYEWLSDNELTPHIVVDAMLPGVRVPQEFIEDGQIVLNIAARAVGQLELGNEAITFHARFGGRPHSVIVPLYAVQAIYARENGAGTMFDPEEAYLDMPEEGVEEEAIEEKTPTFSVAHAADTASDAETTSRTKSKATLRVIK